MRSKDIKVGAVLRLDLRSKYNSDFAKVKVLALKAPRFNGSSFSRSIINDAIRVEVLERFGSANYHPWEWSKSEPISGGWKAESKPLPEGEYIVVARLLSPWDEEAIAADLEARRIEEERRKRNAELHRAALKHLERFGFPGFWRPEITYLEDVLTVLNALDTFEREYGEAFVRGVLQGSRRVAQDAIKAVNEVG